METNQLVQVQRFMVCILDILALNVSQDTEYYWLRHASWFYAIPSCIDVVCYVAVTASFQILSSVFFMFIQSSDIVQCDLQHNVLS
jgi:bacteriorhodopsin